VERFRDSVRQIVMKRWTGLVLLALIAVSCSFPAVVTDSVSFTSPEPPDEFASGLTIGFIPEGFAWVWNEGHETATFHTFQTADESSQLSVGIQVSPPPHPGSGEEVSRAGRQFVAFDLEREIRVTEAVGNDVRLDVVSASLDEETLLRVAESVTFKPTATAKTVLSVAAGGLVVPDCNDTASCAAGFILDDGVFYNLGCRAVRDAEGWPLRCWVAANSTVNQSRSMRLRGSIVP